MNNGLDSAPCSRLLDTSAQLGYQGPKPEAGTTVELQVAGRAGVPAGGAAVVLNVTATDTSAAGFITVWPTGTLRPLTSSLNVSLANISLAASGQTIANLVTVPLGAGGKVSLFTQSGAHLVADVVGFYEESSASAAGRLRSVDPVRVLDTRAGPGYTGAQPAADQTVTFAVAGQGGVPPSGASAVVLNITATDAGGPGYVTAFASGSPRPPTSNLNIEREGQTIANQVLVPFGPDGRVSLYTYGSTHLIADVAGWFTDDSAPVATGGLFVAIVPERHLDTRSAGAPVAAGGTVNVVAGSTVIPSTGVLAVVANLTATEAAGAGFVTAYPAGSLLPLASNLNLEFPGQTLPNHVTVRLGTGGAFTLYTYSPAHLIADLTGYYLA